MEDPIQPEPTPAPLPPEIRPADPADSPGPKWRRKALLALIGLHAFAAVAAVVVLLKSPARKTGDADGGASRGLKLLSKPKENVIAWLPIHGVITQSESGRAWERGIEQWGKKLRALADKNEVKAIILEINSPGGSVGAVQELHAEILRVRSEKKKPVVALLGDIAASGGYYLAAACDKIVAHPGTLVGSIGVIFNTMNVEGLIGKLGVKIDPIKSGKHKDIGSATRPMTAEEKALLQALIDNAYGQFLGAVVEGRKLPEADVRPLADGRIFTGEQAHALKLVDELGDSKKAIDVAAKLAKLEGEPKVLRDGDSIESFLSLLEMSIGRFARPEAAVMSEIHKLVPIGLEYRWMP